MHIDKSYLLVGVTSLWWKHKVIS